MLELLHIENIAIIERGQTFCSAAGSTRSPGETRRGANPS